MLSFSFFFFIFAFVFEAVSLTDSLINLDWLTSKPRDPPVCLPRAEIIGVNSPTPDFPSMGSEE